MDYSKTFKKYLDKIDIQNHGKIHKHPNLKYYERFIVIPCYAEFDYVFQTLESINQQDIDLLQKCLVIIVINNSKSSSEDIKNNNYKTYQALDLKKYNFEFIMIDCFSEQYAINDNLAGVGMARKIGLDYCLMYAKNKNSLLCSLDADTLISKNYLKYVCKLFKNNIAQACVVNFKHQKSSNIDINKGIKKYESILKNIAQNIDKVGSPYGYVSLGSTIVCTINAYIACGGMSKKKATEDFYFLQALAKYTKILQLETELVYPSSRYDQRVYLGTGFRMNEYKKNKKFQDLEYSDTSFKQLKDIIDLVNSSWEYDYKKFYDIMRKKISKKAIIFLIDKKIESVWYKMQQNAKNKNQFNQIMI